MLSEIKRLLNGEISTNYLIKKGMNVGENFHRGSGCFIDPSHCFLITIGNNVTFSINVTLLAHDASSEKLVDYTKIGQISVEDNVFVGANVTILPNVRIGKNSIIGAGSVVSKSIPENVVAAGNPAHILCTIEEYKSKCFSKLEKSHKFSEKYTMREGVTLDMKKEIIEATSKGIDFIK